MCVYVCVCVCVHVVLDNFEIPALKRMCCGLTYQASFLDHSRRLPLKVELHFDWCSTLHLVQQPMLGSSCVVKVINITLQNRHMDLWEYTNYMYTAPAGMIKVITIHAKLSRRSTTPTYIDVSVKAWLPIQTIIKMDYISSLKVKIKVSQVQNLS